MLLYSIVYTYKDRKKWRTLLFFIVNPADNSTSIFRAFISVIKLKCKNVVSRGMVL